LTDVEDSDNVIESVDTLDSEGSDNSVKSEYSEISDGSDGSDGSIEMAESLPDVEDSDSQDKEAVSTIGIDDTESAVSEEKKNDWDGMFYPVIIMAGFFLVAQFIAVLASPRYIENEFQAFGEDTDSMSHTIYYIIFLLLFSAFVLYLARKGAMNVIQFIFLGAMGMTICYALFPPLDYIFSTPVSMLITLIVSGILFLLL